MPELARDEKGGPEPRKGVRFLWFAVAVVVAAGASGGGIYVYTQYATHLAVTGINWQLYVNNTSMGYLFNSEASGCQGQCPANAPVNSVWIYTLVFVYGPTEYNLSVVNMTLPQPFYLLGISPSVPKELAAGSSSVSFRIAIQLPATPGSRSVLGAVWVA